MKEMVKESNSLIIPMFCSCCELVRGHVCVMISSEFRKLENIVVLCVECFQKKAEIKK